MHPIETRDRFDVDRVAKLYRELLVALGEDPDRDGLRDTPGRVAAWWREFLDPDLGRLHTAFDEALPDDQLVVVRGITVWSLCEHHLLPFRLDLTIGYLPGSHVLGLSKFARIAARHAHRLQLQERLTRGVLDDVLAATGSPDVAVIADGEHLCMSMRGVRTQARTTTAVMRGRFDTDPQLAAKAFAIAQLAAPAVSGGPRPAVSS